MYRVAESQSCDRSTTIRGAHKSSGREVRAGGGMEDKRDWMENRN